MVPSVGDRSARPRSQASWNGLRGNHLCARIDTGHFGGRTQNGTALRSPYAAHRPKTKARKQELMRLQQSHP